MKTATNNYKNLGAVAAMLVLFLISGIVLCLPSAPAAASAETAEGALAAADSGITITVDQVVSTMTIKYRNDDGSALESTYTGYAFYCVTDIPLSVFKQSIKFIPTDYPTRRYDYNDAGKVLTGIDGSEGWYRYVYQKYIPGQSTMSITIWLKDNGSSISGFIGDTVSYNVQYINNTTDGAQAGEIFNINTGSTAVTGNFNVKNKATGEVTTNYEVSGYNFYFETTLSLTAVAKGLVFIDPNNPQELIYQYNSDGAMTGNAARAGWEQYYYFCGDELYCVVWLKDNGASIQGILVNFSSIPWHVRYFMPQVMPDNPVRDYYDFAGWYYDEALTEPYQDGDTITADTDFYPKWIAIQYSISYVLNNGVNGENPISYNVDDNVILLNPASRTGYTFIGWYTAADFSGSSITSIPSGSFGEKILYAKFEIIMCKVTFYVNQAVYAEFEIEYGSALVNPDGSASAAAAGLESVDYGVLLSAYGIESLSSVTADLELNAVVLSNLAKWNAFGLWIFANWIWLIVGFAVLIAAVVTVVVVWRRA